MKKAAKPEKAVKIVKSEAPASTSGVKSLYRPNKTEAVAKKLTVLLGTTYALYLKTQNFHWNVTGPYFAPLHALFEAQYDALAEAVDETAERLRAIGHVAPGGFQAFAKLALITDAPAEPPAALDMVKMLAEDHKTLTSVLQSVMDVADDADDETTEDFATQRKAAHEKMAWMLNATLS